MGTHGSSFPEKRRGPNPLVVVFIIIVFILTAAFIGSSNIMGPMSKHTSADKLPSAQRT
jgi:hypothetical protein